MNQKKKPEAHCYSMLCTGEFSISHCKSVKKDVSRGTFSCPDCGCALMWKISNYRRGTELKKKYLKIDERGSNEESTLLFIGTANTNSEINAEN